MTDFCQINNVKRQIGGDKQFSELRENCKRQQKTSGGNQLQRKIFPVMRQKQRKGYRKGDIKINEDIFFYVRRRRGFLHWKYR